MWLPLIGKGLTLNIRIFWIIIVALGLFFLFAIPPFQKADEIVHYYKAVSIASGTIACRSSADGTLRNPIPKYLVTLPDELFASHIAFTTNAKFGIRWYGAYFTRRHFDRTPVNEVSSCSLPFVYYIPAALIMMIPVAVGSNPIIIFFLGRLANFITAMALLYIAFRIIPVRFNKLLLFFVSIPMVLIQASSLSKDALHLASGLLVFAFILRFREQPSYVALRSLVLFFIALGVTIFARLQYAPLVLLVILIPGWKKLWKRFGNLTMSRLVLLSFITALCTAIGIMLVYHYSQKTTQLLTVSSRDYVYPLLQFERVLADPFEFLRIIDRTIQLNISDYLISMVGNTGWLATHVPWYVAVLYVGGFFFLAQDNAPAYRATRGREAIVLHVLIGVVSLSLFLSFYLFWTPIGAAKIDGVQGRYFLVLIPYVLWLLSVWIGKWSRMALIVSVITVLSSSIWITYERYYHYETFFYRDVGARSFVTNRSERVAMLSQIRNMLTVDPTKKLTGISIYVPMPNIKPNISYRMVVRDETCKKVLRQTYIDMPALQYEQYNDIVIAPIRPKSSQICWTMEPLTKQNQKNVYLELQKDTQTNDVVALPVYVH